MSSEDSSSQKSSTPVLLLKTKSSPTDPYDTLFSSTGGYTAIFIPVLQHRSVNSDLVKEYILDGVILSRSRVDGEEEKAGEAEGGKRRFGGLVITSQRAVEALSGILDELKESNESLITSFLSTTLIYVVGPATRNALINLGFSAVNVLGEESGNGAALADFIIDDYREGCQDLLFLTGETHSTTIPSRVPEKLKEEMGVDMKVDEVVVYKTGVVEHFEDEFRGWLDKLDDVQKENGKNEKDEREVRWIVVFSPTGTDAALKVVAEKEEKGLNCKYKICTIGPTTTDFMEQAFKRRPDAIARTPSPEGLLEAMKEGSRLGLELVL
ncbi:hypothetical protein ABW20_dc0100571 [Dactylellina cionopaga]|nr:hypothetical protein ABW20_dc0100571 [Dactylellina cionopaga]